MQTYVIVSEHGRREWQADDVEHAREQHEDAFPEERILTVRQLVPYRTDDDGPPACVVGL